MEATRISRSLGFMKSRQEYNSQIIRAIVAHSEHDAAGLFR